MSLVRITQEIVGQQYELGSRDCFRIVYDYLSRFINLPREWHGLTLEDYFQVFQQDPEEAKELIRQFLDEYLQSISSSKCFAGDILLLQHPEYSPFPAIHAGNRHFIGADPNRGIMVFPLVSFEIKRAWRCL